MNCVHCGASLREQDKFCPKCGKSVQAPVQPPVEETVKNIAEPISEAPETAIAIEEPKPKKKKKSKLPIIIISVVLAFTLILGGAAAALYFIDPMDLFGNGAEKDGENGSKEEKNEITEDILNGYWISKIDTETIVKNMIEYEFDGEVEMVGNVSIMDAVLYINGDEVISYYISEQMFIYSEELYSVMANSVGASKTLQEETGYTEEGLIELFFEDVDFEEDGESFRDDYGYYDIFTYEKDEDSSYKIKGNKVTFYFDDIVYEMKYTDDGELDVVGYENDDDSFFNENATDMLFTKLSDEELDKLYEKYACVDDEYIDNWVESCTEKYKTKETFSFGNTYGQDYYNSYLGIGCSLSEDWYLFSKEEVAELNGYDFKFDEINDALQNGIAAIDMYAYHNDFGDNVTVVVEAVNLRDYGITIEEFISIAIENFEISESASLFSEMSNVVGTVSLDGEEYYAVFREAFVQGVPTYQTQVIIDCGDCITTITASTFNENRCEEILSQFYIN